MATRELTDARTVAGERRFAPSKPTPEPRALIIEDGLSRHVVAAARGLAAGGWTVGIGSATRGFSASSRAVERWHEVPGAEADLEGFVEGVTAAVEDGGYTVVFGARDVEAIALSQVRDRIPAIVPYPPHEVVLSSFDKLNLGQAAAAAGIATPEPMTAVNPRLTPAGRVIVKARFHAVLDRPGSPPRIDGQAVTSVAARDRRVAEILGAGGLPLVQEHIDGTLMSLTILLGPRGDLIARAQQEAELIYPPWIGVSVRATTVEVDRDLAARAVVMLRDLGWHGLAQLQFLVPEDGVPRLIDFNGRFYGSLALAIAAGANFPALWADAAIGREAVPAEAAPGHRYQWLWGDLRRALVERRGGLARDLFATGRFAFGAAHSVWGVRDRSPVARYIGARLRGGVSKALPAKQD